MTEPNIKNDKSPYNSLENYLFCHKILGDGKLVTGKWDMTIKTCKQVVW